MLHKFFGIFMILMMGMLLIPSAGATQAALPPAPWYAVTWVQATDTLHWVNADGEQVSIPRPTWADENPAISPKMQITPDGRTLIQVVMTNSGSEQIGFHNLETGALLASHESQLGEAFIWSVDNPSPIFSPRFAIGLSAPDVSQWRIIVFDTVTGSAIGQLTSQDAGIALPANTHFPYVLHYELEEGLGQLIVNFQMRTAAGDAFPYEWMPEVDNLQVVAGDLGYNPNDGYDIDLVTDAALFAINNQSVQAMLGDELTALIDETGVVSTPRWLSGTQWMAYAYEDGVFAPHWRVGLAEENTQIVPLGPNMSDVYGTPDGFLAQDGQTHVLMHSTALPTEGHQAQIGTVIFDPVDSFEVIYVTAWGASFSLPSVFYNGGVETDIDDVAVPEVDADCSEAPISRLAIGMRARVTFTDGIALRVRTAPNGEIITSLTEGTEFNIIGGSLCENGYIWWQIQTDDAVIGWSAEGADDSYFIEQVLFIAPPIEPTVEPTNVPPVLITPVIVGPPEPTATPMVLIFVPQCHASPATRLSVGDHAHTNTTGTLALRTNLSDPTPSHQVPDNVSMLILEGPQCAANGQRMWRVRLTVNNQTVEGWMAEGWDDTYYLVPGLAILGG